MADTFTSSAQASRASLIIAFEPQAVTMTISDDGRGFEAPESPAQFAPSGHFGLLGLHERAELVGAHFDIQSSPGSGTQVIVHLPSVSPFRKQASGEAEAQHV